MKEVYTNAFKKICEAKKVAIYTHANVDGDAVGSAFAFYFFLKGLGKEVDVFSKTTIPSQLKFLNIEQFINKKTCENYDLAIGVDCNTFEMMNLYGQKFMSIKNNIQFDHHRANPNYASLNVVNPEVSSTCELVADFLFSLNASISDVVAKFLLTGIITDSGGFKFSCTSNKTIDIVYKLLNISNLKLSDIMAYIFESEEPEYLQLYKEAINNTKLLYDNKVALIVIKNNFYKTTGIDPNSAKNLTRIGTEIKTVKFTALIAEVEPNVCKVSFRSRNEYDCSKCAQVFGGGGHKQASGCKIFGKVNDTVDKVLKSITDVLQW